MTNSEFLIEVNKLGITLTKLQIDQLETYYQILIEYNRKVNLTRIIEKKDVYLKHFYDSITLTKAIDLTQNLSICDVGSGAGFPGVVLKIVFPNLEVTLIDSLNKRIVFLNELINKLNLKDIEAIHIRAEEYKIKKFDIVTSRAVASLPKLAEICLPLVKKHGLFIAMKASIDEEIKLSIKNIKKYKCSIDEIISFNLYKNENTRNLIIIKKD